VKILIVDDEAHIRQMLRLTLVAAGYEVEEAVDGEDALRRFGDGRQWAAVLLDQKMPGIDGLETLRQMKARLPEACVIMVTAFASIDLAVDAMRLGATDFLRKPMTPEMVRGSISAALANRARTPVRGTAGGAAHGRPSIETVTLNGFHVVRTGIPHDPASADHGFEVTHFPDGARSQVTVSIDPEAVARVTRLTRRTLPPGGRFWSEQAERRLSSYLWTEDRVPDGPLRVEDVSREDIDIAATWELD
jgi:DNA-binding response OmpR family regulator